MTDPSFGSELVESPARTPWPLWKKIALRATLAVLVGGGILSYQLIHNHGRAVDQSAAVTAAANADSCSYSGYEITPTGGKRELVYNCLAGAKAMCVTYEGGIASNSTVLVKAIFSDALGGNKPECVTTSS